MKRKQGISLIVLVITIIVMVILAAAVVITLSNTGIINRANVAVKKTNQKQIEQLASLAWSEAFMEGARTQAELQSAVDEALKDVDTTGVTVTVTTTGVSVTDGNGNNTTPQNNWRIEREYDDNGLITKAVVTDGTVEYEIGTTVNYMPDGVGTTSYKGGWKLLGVDSQGRLLIMSSDSITGSDVQLSGRAGYINGLTTLQNTVNGYKDGIIGVAVRSVTAEDIDAVTGYDPATFTGEELLDYFISIGYTEEQILAEKSFTTREELNLINNGLSVTYSWDGTEYPKYSYIINGITKTGNLKFTHTDGFTYYDSTTNSFKTISYTVTPGTIVTIVNNMHSYYGTQKYTQTSKIYKMIFMTVDESKASEYWLASQFNGVAANCIGFGLRCIKSGMIDRTNLVQGNGLTHNKSCAVRAVVTLASGITLEDSTTITGTYDIVQ